MVNKTITFERIKELDAETKKHSVTLIATVDLEGPAHDRSGGARHSLIIIEHNPLIYEDAGERQSTSLKP